MKFYDTNALLELMDDVLVEPFVISSVTLEDGELKTVPAVAAEVMSFIVMIRVYFSLEEQATDVKRHTRLVSEQI